MTPFLLFLVHLAVAASNVVFPTPTTVVTSDGMSLAASWGLPAKATSGVVFVPMAGRGKEDWTSLAERFYRQGVAVLSLDLRGQGANPRSTTELSEADAAKMILDVQAALDALEARGLTRLAVVGAELGANLALQAAVAEPKVVSLVLLSPGMSVKGVTAQDAMRLYGARPVLLVASNDDAYSARSAGMLASLAAGPHALELYQTAGKGTKMLGREPTLEATVVGYVQSNWEKVVAEAAPAMEFDLGQPTTTTTGPTTMPGQ